MPLASLGSRSISGSGKLGVGHARAGQGAELPPEVEASVIFRNLPPNCPFARAERQALRKYASRLNIDIAQGRGFDCLVTNDGSLRAMNRRFLGHDYATDVLSFPSETRRGPVGEMAISLERAEEQAREHGHSTLEEMEILMLHGVLHLLGHDHERDRGKMARLEQRWRVTFALPAGLIGRGRHQRKAVRRNHGVSGKNRAVRSVGQ